MCDEPFCFYSGVRRHLDADYDSYDGPWTHFDADGTVIDHDNLNDKWRDLRQHE